MVYGYFREVRQASLDFRSDLKSSMTVLNQALTKIINLQSLLQQLLMQAGIRLALKSSVLTRN